MNSIKHIFTAFALAIAIGTIRVSAQPQPIAFNDRYGTTEDEISQCQQSIALYREFYQAKDYKSAYEPWKEVFTKHPISRYQMYAEGRTILKTLLKSEKDEKKKDELIQEILRTYDQHIEHLDTLNKYYLKAPLPKGYILGLKANDYVEYIKPIDVVEIYSMLYEAINSAPERTNEMMVVNYMKASSTIAKYRKNHKEQVIADYLKISDLTTEQIQKANENAAKGDANASGYEALAKNWESVKSISNRHFLDSGAGSAEDLQAIYAPQIEENKDNLKFLKQVINVLRRVPKGRDQEAYLAASEYAHIIEPTAASARGCASRYSKREEYEKAIEFMEQAIELGTDNYEKAEDCFATAQMYFQLNQYPKAKSYANQAITLDDHYGKPYVLLAQMYANNNKWSDESAMNKCTYFLAIDKLQRAKSVDPTVAEDANRLIGIYSAYTPKPEDLFFLGIKKGDKVTIGGWIGETTTVR